jgi:hypothetical protein
MYRTGDLARWVATGEVEYLGRLDHQVKVRGFRIELGEIESALQSLEGVREAAVIVREDTPGDPRIVAYVVASGGAEPQADALRSALKKTLPEYMVPSAFVTLAALPVTPNGKLDRKALPAPDAQARSSVYVAPSNEVEEVLAAIWSDVLGVPRVSVTDDFFALGGHSLLAIRVVARVARDLEVEVPMRLIFEGPTVRELAGLIELALREE